ncbi:hypothetical protein LOK46_14410 [Methylobacterium sp. NMS14P]|uniref:hypothetical protein n=1 Tax=Methylobacterium sp. NMS14P TaxID=2894310 RepID=UPI002359EDA5|nr:hypothetical protein [Methylobacterium sp. NMS14P]WCS27965.1 hypothetical protein LOK46_14410 [Methylobacterium sp. NMS14P]
MDALALEAPAKTKAELDRTEELARALRTTSLHPHACGPGSEDLFAVAKEVELFLRVTGSQSNADRFQGEVATAVDTAPTLHSYRLRIRLLRAGVHV